MKRDTPEHAKTGNLADLLCEAFPSMEPVAHLVAMGVLEGMWHHATKYTPDGCLSKYPLRRLKQALQWPESIEALVDCLAGARWVDRLEDGRIFVHDWPDHCQDSVHKALAKAVVRFADGTFPKFSKLGHPERRKCFPLWLEAYGEAFLPILQEASGGDEWRGIWSNYVEAKNGRNGSGAPSVRPGGGAGAPGVGGEGAQKGGVVRPTLPLPVPSPLPSPRPVAEAEAGAVRPQCALGASAAAASPISDEDLPGVKWIWGSPIEIDEKACPVAPWAAVYFRHFGELPREGECEERVDDSRLPDWALVCWIWKEHPNWDFRNLDKMFDRLRDVPAHRAAWRALNPQAASNVVLVGAGESVNRD